MTALDAFQRLEAPGIWKADEAAQRRDVVVSFGEATLTIATGNDEPISHWSLAAIRRLNPGERPALFCPGSDSSERLEVADPTLIDAIEQVRRSVQRSGPHPRRLRWLTSAVIGVIVLGVAVVWLPGAMIRYTVSVVPDSKRAQIGDALMAQIQTLTGAPCDAPLGRQALADLQQRLMPGDSGRIYVLRSMPQPSLHLPGHRILLNRSVVEDTEEPEAAAGYVLAEDLRMEATDPLHQALSGMGLRASFQLLTTGDISEKLLLDYSEHLLAKLPHTVDDEALLSRFRASGVRATPYAYAVDVTGETTVELIEADPIKPNQAKPVLDDSAWVSLQSICGG